MKIKNHKIIKITSLAIVSVLLITIISFLIYASKYYKADSTALSILNGGHVDIRTDRIVLSPATPGDTGFIFYPGAKVEYTAYLPLLDKLRNNGIKCILLKMPFNMAIFDVNAADSVFDDFPDISNWYIGGHSMGGAMASSYAAKHQDRLSGLILLGAYIYGDYPPDKALTIYGTFNSNLEKNIHYTENILVIPGGNHAQFGNYGKQKGDPDATITAEEQQNIAVTAILEFMNIN